MTVHGLEISHATVQVPPESNWIIIDDLNLSFSPPSAPELVHKVSKGQKDQTMQGQIEQDIDVSFMIRWIDRLVNQTKSLHVVGGG